MVGPKAKIHLERLKANYDLIRNRVNRKPLMAVVKPMGMAMAVFLVQSP